MKKELEKRLKINHKKLLNTLEKFQEKKSISWKEKAKKFWLKETVLEDQLLALKYTDSLSLEEERVIIQKGIVRDLKTWNE